ncbi:hypothetical protein ALC53_02880 [Atta colombica]|uniref:Uncharacterized protein n=1 Tax=Atta colombica TaxID=520822 RepID=A0A195BPF2_9HYME|nr:hypothetical protein ALC53_02880 [Atta colombica]
MLLVETKIALVLSREIDRHVLQTAAGIRVLIAEARHVPLAAKEVELRRDESLASPRVRDTPSVISDEDYCANRVVICSDAVMGCSSRSFFLTTLLLVAGLLSIALFAEISCATRKSLFSYLWELS